MDDTFAGLCFLLLSGKFMWARLVKKEKGWIKILPRFKIQFPMKNCGKDAASYVSRQELKQNIF